MSCRPAGSMNTMKILLLILCITLGCLTITLPIGAQGLSDTDQVEFLLFESSLHLEQGEILFLQFCVMCHGETGAGDGPVVGPNRLPPLPTLNLLSERAQDLSDGYIYGMIANGRGVMPSYRRVQHEDRWYLVEYVRKLQEEAPAAE